MTLDEYYAMTAVETLLPLTFATTKATLTELTVLCGGCERELSPRGFVIAVHGPASYRSPPEVVAYRIAASAFCEPCRLLTPMNYTVHDDFTIRGEDPATGEPSVWLPRERWWRRFLRAVTAALLFRRSEP